jgi:hypothetical protein
MPLDAHRRLLELLQSLVTLLLQEKSEDSRRPALTEFIRISIEVCFDGEYHFSEFCQAVADFALTQAETWPQREATTWRNTALILQTAVQEAETEGRELP